MIVSFLCWLPAQTCFFGVFFFSMSCPVDGLVPSLVLSPKVQWSSHLGWRFIDLGAWGFVRKVHRRSVGRYLTSRESTYPPWNYQFAPENRLSPKETSLQTIHFQVWAVSFREGTLYQIISSYPSILYCHLNHLECSLLTDGFPTVNTDRNGLRRAWPFGLV